MIDEVACFRKNRCSGHFFVSIRLVDKSNHQPTYNIFTVICCDLKSVSLFLEKNFKKESSNNNLSLGIYLSDKEKCDQNTGHFICFVLNQPIYLLPTYTSGK